MLQGQLHDFEVLELRTGASHAGLHVAFARRGVLLHGPFGAPLKGTHAIPECPRVCPEWAFDTKQPQDDHACGGAQWVFESCLA